MQEHLNRNEITITIILIPHNNQQKFKTRIERDIIPTIKALPQWNFQVIIVDNSDKANQIILDPLYEINIFPLYLWPGTNIMYGPALNLAVSVNPYPYMVYLCSNHGHMYDPTWLDDLITPIIENPKVAMTGSLYNSCQPAAMGFPAHLSPKHIQGGIFAARTETMKKYPYTKDHRWLHWGSDVYQCFQLLNAGFLLHDVPTIKSVWRQNVSKPEKWKYVHDYSE
ncbi:MAG: glycosyltransferase family A protein [Ginsengibacter sp.]